MTASQKLKNLYGTNSNQESGIGNELDQGKKEGAKIYSFFIARKYGLKWHQKMTKL